MEQNSESSGRIVHVIGALVAGGAERYVVELLVALRRRGLPVELACLLPRRDAVGDKWAAKLEEAGVPIVGAGPAGRMSLATARWLAGLLRQPGIDIVHIHLHYTEFAYYVARFMHRRRYRVIRTIHNTSLPETRRSAWAFRRSDIRYSITCGEATHEVYTNGTIRVRGTVRCVPYGVTFDWPVHDVARREERLRALGLDPSKTHFVVIGRQMGDTLEKAQKAHDDLIKAWKAGRLGEKGGVLHLLGTGNLAGQLKELAGGDESIAFHGVLANAHEWLSACDTYVMPSRWEGLPLAGIEAVGTGIPCVFSDIEPHHELDCSVASFFPVGDVEALARRLEERLGRFEDAKAEDVERLRRRFGIEESAREYEAAYTELA